MTFNNYLKKEIEVYGYFLVRKEKRRSELV